MKTQDSEAQDTRKERGKGGQAFEKVVSAGFLLASQRAVPVKLTDAGFRFRHPTLLMKPSAI